MKALVILLLLVAIVQCDVPKKVKARCWEEMTQRYGNNTLRDSKYQGKGEHSCFALKYTTARCLDR